MSDGEYLIGYDHAEEAGRDKLLAEQVKSAKLEAKVRQLQALVKDGNERYNKGFNEGVAQGRDIGEDEHVPLLRELEQSERCLICNNYEAYERGHLSDCALGNALKGDG